MRVQYIKNSSVPQAYTQPAGVQKLIFGGGGGGGGNHAVPNTTFTILRCSLFMGPWDSRPSSWAYIIPLRFWCSVTSLHRSDGLCLHPCTLLYLPWLSNDFLILNSKARVLVLVVRDVSKGSQPPLLCLCTKK